MDILSFVLVCFGLASMAQVGFSLCIPPNNCIEDMEEADAKERLDYVLGKYEELEMKIPGEAVGLHGKVVTHGEVEEQHLVFQYMDNTPHDIIQTCAFVVTSSPGECESIGTYCSAFLRRLPRPLLERQRLDVCEDGVRVATEPPEPEEEPDTDTDADPNADAEAAPERGGGGVEAEATTAEQPSSRLRNFH